MASGDHFDFIKASAFVRQGAALDDILRPSGRLAGVPLGKADAYGSEFAVNHNGTPLATGITVQLLVVDDPENPSPSGNVRLGVSIKPLTSGSSDLSGPPAANEVLATVAVSGTVGVITIADVAVPNAKLAGLAAGGRAFVQVRRVGTDAADTHRGRVLLTGASLRDT
jgi:hypothetical protein